MSHANGPGGELSYVNNGGRSLSGRDSSGFMATVAAVRAGRMNRCSLGLLTERWMNG